VLGWHDGRLLQSPAEDNALLFGVQRSGKTSTVVVPTLLSWEGAVVATSTKEELVSLTSHHRALRGPLWVFAPLDRDHAWMHALGLRPATWNPLDSVDSCGSAAELADHFTAEGKRGHSAHWYLAASSLITGLAVCEQERGSDMRTVLARLNRTAHSEFVGLSGVVEDKSASELLLAFALTSDKEAGSIASTARSSLSLWTDERVAAATRTSPDALDLDRLLREAGTLYLVAPAEEAERCRPLFSALLLSLLRRATSKARAQGGVLMPRLLLALDEAANFARILASPATPPAVQARASNSCSVTTTWLRSSPATAKLPRARSGTTAARACCSPARVTSRPLSSSAEPLVTRRALIARITATAGAPARANSALVGRWRQSTSCDD